MTSPAYRVQLPRPHLAAPDSRALSTAQPINVHVQAADQMAAAHLMRLLQACADLSLSLSSSNDDPADVLLLTTDRLSTAGLTDLPLAPTTTGIVLVVGTVREGDQSDSLNKLLRSGVAVGVVDRHELSSAVLRRTILAVHARQSVLPASLLAVLLGGRTPTAEPALPDREVNVLRLLADGSDTREIAHRLCYSERTVKAVIQDVTRRLDVRNRSHAVAYALRHQLI